MAVQVKCVVDASQQHTAAYDLLGEYDEDYFVFEPRQEGDDWLCDINYYPERYVAEFNTTFQNLKHVQNDEKIVPVTLIWAGDSWQLKTQGRVHVTEVYTVTYTDGVENEEVFADQVYTVKEGDATPAFDGTPAREGYVFLGWEPEVAETVTGDATYVATWELETYTITYDFRKVVKTSDVKNLNNPTTFTIEDLPLTLNAPSFKNNEWPQKFLNWRDADGNVVTEITEPGDITLCAYYQYPVRYRVYDEDGKVVEALTVIDWYNEDDFASYEVRPATVDMPGYELDGWYQTLKDAGNVNKRFGSLYMAKKYELVGKLNCCINVTVEVNGETVNEQKFTGAKGGTPDYRSLYSDIVISAAADGSLVEYATYIDGERSTGTLPVFGTNANVRIVITTASIG